MRPGSQFPIYKHGACVPVAVSDQGGGELATQVLRPQSSVLPNRRLGAGHGRRLKAAWSRLCRDRCPAAQEAGQHPPQL